MNFIPDALLDQWLLEDIQGGGVSENVLLFADHRPFQTGSAGKALVVEADNQQEALSALAGGITLDMLERYAQTGVALMVISASCASAPADMAVIMESAP